MGGEIDKWWIGLTGFSTVSLIILFLKSRRMHDKKSLMITKERFVGPRNLSDADFPTSLLSSDSAESTYSSVKSKSRSSLMDNSMTIIGDSLERPRALSNASSNPLSAASSSWTNGRKSDQPIPAAIDALHKNHMDGKKLVIVMVGLPGAGKTRIAMKIARYLRWINVRTRAFSLAKYRLDQVGRKPAFFFDPDNSQYYEKRINILTSAIEDALLYLNGGGDVAIIDGTNTTMDRRVLIRDRLNGHGDGSTRLLWIESLLSSSNDEMATFAEGPDYTDQADFEQRVAHYKKNYEGLTDSDGSCIIVSDHKVTLQQIHGYIPTKIVSFVTNLHAQPRKIYLCRHGESEFNVRGLIGGDSRLTGKGYEFAAALRDHLSTIYPNGKSDEEGDLIVWTSTLRRARDTAENIDSPSLVEWRALRDLEVGVCDGLSYKQIQVTFPEEFRQREQNKLTYRYPRGESYLDVISRLEQVIYELERVRKPLVIIGHQAVLRCLYAYFLDLPEANLPHLAFPLHTMIQLTPKGNGYQEKRFRFVVDGQVRS